MHFPSLRYSMSAPAIPSGCITFDTLRYLKVSFHSWFQPFILNPLQKKPPKQWGMFGQAQQASIGTARAYEPEQDVKNSRKKGGESNEKERIPSL
jgi:hypothetical protein